MPGAGAGGARLQQSAGRPQQVPNTARPAAAASVAEATSCGQKQHWSVGRWCDWALRVPLSISFPCTAEERLDLVEVFVADTALRTTLQQELRHVPDFHRLARKMKTGKGSLQVSDLLLCAGLTPHFNP